jgi:hypothetical protein
MLLSPFNGTFQVQASGNALSIALKTQAGADPTPADPVTGAFLDAAGGWHPVTIGAPLSTTIPQGATLGTVGTQPFRLYWFLIDGASPQIAVILCSGNGRLLRPSDGTLQTAQGLSSFSANGQVLYAPSAVANQSARLLGHSTWETGLPAAGQWSVNPSWSSLWQPGMPVAGDVIDSNQTTCAPFRTSGGAANQWIATPLQNSLSMKSAANYAAVSVNGALSTWAAGDTGIIGVFRAGQIVGLPGLSYNGAGGSELAASLNFNDAPGIVGPVAWQVFVKCLSNSIVAFPDWGGTNFSPAVAAVFDVAEVMG